MFFHASGLPSNWVGKHTLFSKPPFLSFVHMRRRKYEGVRKKFYQNFRCDMVLNETSLANKLKPFGAYFFVIFACLSLHPIVDLVVFVFFAGVFGIAIFDVVIVDLGSLSYAVPFRLVVLFLLHFLIFPGTNSFHFLKITWDNSYLPSATSSQAHLLAIRGKRKRGPGTLQTRD